MNASLYPRKAPGYEAWLSEEYVYNYRGTGL